MKHLSASKDHVNRFFKILIITLIGIACLVLIHKIREYTETVQLTFSYPSSSWCVDVREEMTLNEPIMRYTTEGEYEGVCTKEGNLQTIPLKIGHTYYIRCADIKSDALRTEFYIHISKNHHIIYWTENTLREDKIERILSCSNSNFVDDIANRLRNTSYMNFEEVTNFSHSLANTANAQWIESPHTVILKKEPALFLFTPIRPLELNDMIPFLYIAIE